MSEKSLENSAYTLSKESKELFRKLEVLNMMKSKPKYQCVVCKKPCLTVCSRCNFSYYCTAEHQTKDWPRHRLECNKKHIQNKEDAQNKKNKKLEKENRKHEHMLNQTLFYPENSIKPNEIISVSPPIYQTPPLSLKQNLIQNTNKIDRVSFRR